MNLSDDNATLNFTAALERLDRVIARSARAKGASIAAAIAVDMPSFDGAPLRYRITLQNGKSQVVVYIDHDALTDADECFAVLTAPQLDAAIGRLRRAEKQWADARQS